MPGPIKYSKDKFLGTGSFGTEVYKGTFYDKDAAVKIFPSIKRKNFDKEFETVLFIPVHVNIRKYYGANTDPERTLMLAFEFCNINLKTYLQSMNDKVDGIDICRQLLNGVCFLHEHGIVHGDLTPSNIMITEMEVETVLKISDFGLSKLLPNRWDAVVNSSMEVGATGWMPPEILRDIQNLDISKSEKVAVKTTFTTDVFSVGCLLYYIISNGQHPFGMKLLREANILHGRCKISFSDINLIYQPNLYVIYYMLQENPINRPTISSTKSFCGFWQKQQEKHFFTSIINLIENSYELETVFNTFKRNMNRFHNLRRIIQAEPNYQSLVHEINSLSDLKELLCAIVSEKYNFMNISGDWSNEKRQEKNHVTIQLFLWEAFYNLKNQVSQLREFYDFNPNFIQDNVIEILNKLSFGILSPITRVLSPEERMELREAFVVTNSLLNWLVFNGALDEDDKNKINSCKSKQRKVDILLSVILSKTMNGYQLLYTALTEEKQMTAASILATALNSNKTGLDKLFDSMPQELKRFFEDSHNHDKNVLILTLDFDLSKIRILDDVGSESILQSVNFDPSQLKDAYGQHYSPNTFTCLGNYDGHTIVLGSVGTKISLHQGDWEIIEDRIHWKDLTEKGKTLVKKRLVRFQNNKILFERVCDIASNFGKLDITSILDKLDTDFLVQILNNQEPDMSGIHISDKPMYYIPRHLSTRHHISRKVLNTTKLNEVLDIFLFKGNNLKLYDLASFVTKYGNGQCDTSGNQIQRNPKKFSVHAMLLETENHFKEICDHALSDVNNRKSVHLFECIRRNGETIDEIKWIKSFGAVSTLQNYVHSVSYQICETELCKTLIQPHPICISVSPGMGKSSLLSSCANQILNASKAPNKITYVQIVDVHAFAANIRAFITSKSQFLFDYPTESDIICVLSETLSSNDFGKTLITSLFGRIENKAVKMHELVILFEIMFDGVDELNFENYELVKYAFQILMNIKQNNISFRIWVTTRPYLLHDIEDCLGVLGYTINPLEVNEQVKLLTDYWIEGTEICRAKIESHSKKYLQALETISSLSDDQNIAGAPLLCFLVAEVFKDQALEHCEDNHHKSLNSGTVDVSIITLYERFVNRRLNKDDDCDFTEILFLNHMEIALQLVFPQHNLSQIVTGPSRAKNITSLLQYKLLETTGSSAPPKFVHKTIADFFAALGIIRIGQRLIKLYQHSMTSTNDELSVDSINDPYMTPFSDDIMSFRIYFHFVSEILFVNTVDISISKLGIIPYNVVGHKFVFSTVCYFINHSDLSNINVIDATNIALYYYGNDRQILANALWEKLVAGTIANYQTFVVFVIAMLEIILNDETLWSIFFENFPENNFFHLLFIAAKFSSVKGIEAICKFIARVTGDPVTFYFLQCVNENESINEFFSTYFPSETLTALHIAIEAGNADVVKYLLNDESFKETIEKDFSLYRFLPHFCVSETVHESADVIDRKVEILKLISEETPFLLFNNVYSKDLILERIHCKLLLKYLKLMAKNVSIFKKPLRCCSRNRYGENFLHLLGSGYYHKHMTALEYNEVLQYLTYIMPNEALRLYLESFNFFGWRAVDVAISSWDLEDNTLLLFKKLRITYNDPDYRYSTTIYKAVSGQRSTKFLKKLISENANFDAKICGTTILHVAATYRNYFATQLFVNEHKIDVNSVDNDRNTPLHLCLRPTNESNLSDCNNNKSSKIFMHTPAVPITRRLNTADENVFFHSKLYNHDQSRRTNYYQRNTELEPSNQHQIIEFLIHKGAKIYLLNKADKTPLHLALQTCLGGLKQEERLLLKTAKHQLFENPIYIATALKGLILNPIFGYVWHPSICIAFASQLLRLTEIGKVDEIYDEIPLLHLAAKNHSLTGVKFLVNVAGVKTNSLDKFNKTPLEYMNCEDKCYKFNCKRIKAFLNNPTEPNLSI